MKLFSSSVVTFALVASLLTGCNNRKEEVYRNTGLSGGGNMASISVSPLDQNLMMLSSNMSGVYISRGGPKQWTLIHYTQLVNSSGSKASFHPQDPDIIFASGRGRLKISRDRGETWDTIGNIVNPQGEIGIHPDRPDLMLTGSGRRVWRSIDGGHQWTQCTGPSGTILGFHFDRTAPAGGGSFFIATTDGIWRSDDGGMNWSLKSPVTVSGPIIAFAGGSNSKNNSIILYCANGNTIFRSTDRGENWTSQISFLDDSVKFVRNGRFQSGLLTTDVDPGIVYAVISLSCVLKSEDAGDNWKNVLFAENPDEESNLEYNYLSAYNAFNPGGGSFSASIAPGNPDFVIFSATMRCIFTEDGGKSWKNAHTDPVIRAGEEKPRTFRNTGLSVTSSWHYYVDPFESMRQYICYTDIGFSRSVDGGDTWFFWPYRGQDRTLPDTWHNTCYEIAFDPDIPGKMWAAFSRPHDIPNSNAILRDHYTRLSDSELQGGVAFSSNFAEEWEYLDWNHGLPNRPTISVIVDPASPKGNRTLYCAVFDQGVYKSTDDGHHWIRKSKGLGSESNMHVIRLQKHPDGTLFCLVTAVRGFSPDGVGLYCSRDGAESWELVNKTQTFLWPKDFAIHPENSDEIYVANDQAGEEEGGLWRSTDGGQSWIAISRMGNHFGVYLHPKKPGWIYMTLCEGSDAQAGLWLSKDKGETWTAFDKVPHRWMQRVDFDPHNEDIILVSTFGASAYRLPADPEDLVHIPGAW